MFQFGLEAKRQIPNFIGMKWTDENIVEFSRIKEELGLTLLNGKDALFLPFVTAGAYGHVGGNYNFPFAVPLFQNILQAAKKGDLKTAQENYLKTLQFTPLLKQYRGIPAIKAIMKMVGQDVGEPRLPLDSLSAQEYKDLEATLKNRGVIS